MIIKKKHLAGCKYIRNGYHTSVHSYSDLTCVTCLKKALVDLDRVNKYSISTHGMMTDTRMMIVGKLAQSGCGFFLKV